MIPLADDFPTQQRGFHALAFDFVRLERSSPNIWSGYVFRNPICWNLNPLKLTYHKVLTVGEKCSNVLNFDSCIFENIWHFQKSRNMFHRWQTIETILSKETTIFKQIHQMLNRLALFGASWSEVVKQ